MNNPSTVWFKLVSILRNSNGKTEGGLFRDEYGNLIYLQNEKAAEVPELLLEIDYNYYNEEGKTKKNYFFDNKSERIRFIKQNSTNLNVNDNIKINRLKDLYGEVSVIEESEIPSGNKILIKRINREIKNGFAIYATPNGDMLQIPEKLAIKNFLMVPISNLKGFFMGVENQNRNNEKTKNENKLKLSRFLFDLNNIDLIDDVKEVDEVLLQIIFDLMKDQKLKSYLQTGEIYRLGSKELLLSTHRLSEENKDLKRKMNEGSEIKRVIEPEIEIQLRREIQILREEINRQRNEFKEQMESNERLRIEFQNTLNSQERLNEAVKGQELVNQNITRILQEKDELIKRLTKENENLTEFLNNRM